MFKDKTLLITGGTGSFGNAVLERMLQTDIKQIRIFSRDEKKQEDMRIHFNHPKLKFYIGDVREFDSVLEAMHSVNFVFHAAALKQVPSCEFYPMEAVRTNVLGTENLLNAALSSHVERVVLLSTDKAVYPVSAMGISKALMEKLMIAKSRMRLDGETMLSATRYGNVMASRGSVIPLFVEQIRAGKPLTVTDANMTRFLMSLRDSVDLVLHAFEHARQGDIFVQKAPASTLGDLVVALQEVFSADNPVRIIGTRHGEKLYESLVSREELSRAEENDRYFRISADDRDLNYNKYFVEGEVEIAGLQDYSSHTTRRLTVPEIKETLLNLEYIQQALNA